LTPVGPRRIVAADGSAGVELDNLSDPSALAPRPRTLGQLLAHPGFSAPPAFALTPFAARSLLQLARTPHRYGFAFSALGSAPHMMAFEGAAGFSPLARGDGFDFGDPGAAATRAVFEMLERVWSTDTPDDRLVAASRDELGDKALEPRAFALLSDEEYATTGDRFVPYASQLRLDWTPARRLRRGGLGEPALAPALLVFPGFGLQRPEQRFAPMLSPGLAAARRYDDALLGGLCEVVERDAFAVAWLLGLPPPRIAQPAHALAADARHVVETLAADGFDVTFHDLTSDVGLPVAMAAVRAKRPALGGGVTLGLGCHPRPGEALAKALREAMQLITNDFDFPGGVGLQHKPRPPLAAARAEVLEAFLSSESISERRWEDTPQPHLGVPMPGLLLDAVEAVARAGQDVWVCDLTPAGEERDLGFVLVRVLVPGLQPHLYEPDCWRLDSPRLAAAARRLGRGVPRMADVQRQPNPFAWETLDGG